MNNNYILRHSDNKLSNFYYHNNSIFYKTFEKGAWNREITILNDVRPNFTLTSSKDSALYLFCQDTKGNLILCNLIDRVWNSRIILANQSNRINTLIFHPIITENGLTLIYNMPSTDDKSQFLMTQRLTPEGVWSQAQKIDSFVTTPKLFFQIQKISNNHLIAFYQTKTSEINLGYREISADKYGNFYPFHTTSYQIVDQAFLATYSDLHFIYIVKSMFSTQLIYRKKSSQHFSNPVVIAEGQRLKNCLLFYASGSLYISFTNGDILFLSKSEDDGHTFKRPVKFVGKIATDLVKAQYISQVPQSKNSIYTQEIYVDLYNPIDIQLLPQLYADFYPSNINISGNNISFPQDSNNNASESQLERLKIMKEKLEIKEMELRERERTLNSKSSNIPKEESDEVVIASQQNILFKREIDKLKDSLYEYEDKISNLNWEIKNKNSEIKKLEELVETLKNNNIEKTPEPNSYTAPPTEDSISYVNPEHTMSNFTPPEEKAVKVEKPKTYTVEQKIEKGAQIIQQ